MTNDQQEDYEAIVVNYLFEHQFAIEPGSAPGDYVVTANGDKELPLQPRLSLDNQILSEYLTAMSEDHQGVPDPLLEALSLAEIHVEEELDKVDLNGNNHATALGVRRDSKGKAVWFVERAELPHSAERSESSEHMRWQAEPPHGRVRESDPDHGGPDFD